MLSVIVITNSHKTKIPSNTTLLKKQRIVQVQRGSHIDTNDVFCIDWISLTSLLSAVQSLGQHCKYNFAKLKLVVQS